MPETKPKVKSSSKTNDEPDQPSIAPLDDPWGIFADIMLRPKRFFAEATPAHLAEGAKAGVVSAVLGFLLGVISTVGINWAISDPQGVPTDSGAVWAAPITLAIIVAALAAEFLISIAVSRLLRGRGQIRTDVLVFDCSLAPTFLWAIPFLGLVVAPVYQVVIFGRGLAKADAVSTGRAYASVIVGLLATFVLFVVTLMFLAVAAGM